MAKLILSQILLTLLWRFLGFLCTDRLMMRDGKGLQPWMLASLHAGAGIFMVIYAAALALSKPTAAAWTAMGICACIVLAVAVKYRPRTWRVLACLAAADAVVIALATVSDRTVVSFDSLYYYIGAGEGIAASGLIGNPLIADLLAETGYFYGLTHSLARRLGLEFFPALLPLFAFHLAAAMLILLARTLQQRLSSCLSRPWLSLAVAAGLLLPLFTNPFMHFNAFYINHHILFAGYFFFGLYFLHDSLRSDDDAAGNSALGVALLCACLSMRLEAKLQIMALAAMTYLQSVSAGRSDRGFQILTGLCATAMLASGFDWLLFQGQSSQFINPFRLACTVLAGLALITAAFLTARRPAGHRFMARWLPRLPGLIMCGLLLLITAAAWNFGKVIPVSLNAMFTATFLATGRWSFLWWYLAALLTVSSLKIGPANRDHDWILQMIGIQLMIIVILAVLRGQPYHNDWGDSANRMLVHFVPTLAFFAILRAIPKNPSSTAECKKMAWK